MQQDYPLRTRSALYQAPKSLTVKLFVGRQGLELLSDKGFQVEWDELYQACPWRTVFQSREFVSVWYQLYGQEHLPILVCAQSKGRTVGILTLAKVKDQNIITGAGENRAFYHTWLSRPDDGQEFFKKALALLRKRFPFFEVRLKYLPPDTPLGWLASSKRWRRQSVLRAYTRLAVCLQAPDTGDLLYSSSLAKKVARLEKLGHLSFDRILCKNEFAAALDTIALQYDLRKAALYNVCPFRQSSQLREFFMILFEQNQLHVTVLRLNGEIIASTLGIVGEDGYFHGALNTHAPAYAKYSPGIVDFFMLGQLLVKEGFSYHDLTPGGNSYKQRLSNASDQVHELTITFTAKALAVKVIHDNLKKLTMYGLSRASLDPRLVRKKYEKVIQVAKERVQLGRKYGVLSLLSGVISKNRVKEDPIALSVRLGQHSGRTGEQLRINRNSLGDLLNFDPHGGNLTRWEYLGEATRRLESGETCYTWMEGEYLAACAWVQFQPKAIWLKSVYFHRCIKASPASFLSSLINTLPHEPKHDRLFAYTQDVAQAGLLEQLGFNRDVLAERGVQQPL